MKASRFNIFVDLENGSKLLFNTASGAMAEITPETEQQTMAILTDPDSVTDVDGRKTLRYMTYGGFLVGDKVDEVARLKVENGRYRFNNPVYSLTVAPTLECNLACQHCDGRLGNGRMTPLIEKGLLGYADPQIKKHDILLVSWVGGEPLLCIDTIERVQNGLMQLAQKHGTAMQPGQIFTNGLLLDQAMAERLAAVGVYVAQVTIDASTRPDSYEQVLANLDVVSSSMNVVVRINVDANDTAPAQKAVKDLDAAGILPNVRVYFGKDSRGLSVCSDAVSNCGLTEADIQTHLQLYRDLASVGSLTIHFPYLVPDPQCQSASHSAIMVAPTGYIFKHPLDLSLHVDNSVGCIFTDEPREFQQDNMWNYESYDPFENAECRECSLLPVCVGGCISPNNTNLDNKKYKCSSLKPHLGDLLRLRYHFTKREEVIR